MNNLIIIILLIHKLRINEYSQKTRDNKDCAKNVPRHSLAAFSHNIVTENTDDWRHDTISDLSGENSIATYFLGEMHHLKQIPCEVDKPDGRTQIIAKVANLVRKYLCSRESISI